MIYVATHADDEVTSVVDTTARDPARPTGDDQVTHTSVRSDLSAVSRRDVHDPNTAANDDQDDRVRIMARGSRDAILRARERHVQRRAPARPTIEPKASDSDTSGDQVIESRNRQHYDPPTDRTARPPSRAAGGDLEKTPPVPREEVQGTGPGLSPAVGPDARFDSIPEVKADIELPRLRQFIHGAQAGPTNEPPAATQLPDVSVSSYDIVLRRAREIKASATGEAQPSRPVPSRPAPTAPAPVSRAAATGPNPAASTSMPPARQVPPETPTVIWDLDPDGIRVAFQRVREAIDQPLPMRREQPTRRVRYEAIADDARPAPADSREPTWYEDEEDFFDASGLDQEEPWTDHSAVLYSRRSEPESPRGSWWRSLNFGIRRRVTLDPAPVPTPGSSTDGYDDAAMYGAPYEDEDEDASVTSVQATMDSWEDDPWSSPESDDQGYGEEFDLHAEEPSPIVTSEQSWLEDELEFPEPQPAEWHESRVALLASRPAIQENPILPSVPIQPATDPQSMPEASSPALPATAPPRQPPPYYAIDQPGGMNAFRAALFGEAGDGEAGRDHWIMGQSPASETPTGGRADREWAVREEREIAVEPSPSATPWWQHPGPARPASRFERGSSLDIPDEILERDDRPGTFEVASRVPKCCRTCRSFRSSEHRDQGWCMNGDAFTHRQMVNADMLSCRSSIGDWWLAADQSWFPPEDEIRPGTPRTDRLLERDDSRNEPSRQNDRRVRTRRAV